MNDEIHRIRARARACLEEAEVTTLPFPHLSIRNFFPADVYERVISHDPFEGEAGTRWTVSTAPDRAGVKMPYHHRRHINLSTPELPQIPPASRSFWDMLRRALLDENWLFIEIARKFPVYFELRFGDASRFPDFWGKLQKALFLQKHDPGYFIGPHTDVPTRVFTCLFSFADREGYEEFGTQIVRPLDRSICCSGRLHYGPAGFEVVHTVPYSPNQFFLFFKTRHSFHAVKPLTADIPNGRFGMQLQCLEPGNGLFTDLSHHDLLSSRATEVAVERLLALPQFNLAADDDAPGSKAARS